MTDNLDEPPATGTITLAPSDIDIEVHSCSAGTVTDLDDSRTSADLFLVFLRRSMRGTASFDPRLRLKAADTLLLQGPARRWPDAAGRLRYVVEQYLLTLDGQNSRNQTLARRALRDIAFLLHEAEEAN
ncbi:hypothetical protein [Gemmobacter sp. LW-1]|uniref:hypothetical protein n=1 Tax=Gemmobacter sp. LW-1 TaxID=1529005 RepID=UPI00128ED09E|nr:hypothetical protein [Gemmobacter sp. LW-1]